MQRARHLLGLIALALAGCGSQPSFEPREIRNVVLVSIDTLRADRLGCYGASQNTSPHIDALAANGARFRHAVSSNPLTLPSHATMLTGIRPPSHGVRDNYGYRLEQDHVTLTEILAENGFSTGAVIGSVILRRGVGLEQGFASYDDRTFVNRTAMAPRERRAEQVSEAAIEFIETQGDQPFFLFLHYYDPHWRYEAPEPYGSRFPDDPYAGEIAYTDAMLQRVILSLEEQGLYDSTLIVLTADHGESLGDHGEVSHSFFIYQTTQHVPLIIRAPGMRGAHVFDGVAGIIDVAPTVLGMLEIPVPEEMTGRDLSGVLRGEPGAEDERYVYCESLVPTKLGCNPLFGLVSERWKYIHTTRPELYHLASDPGEKRNVIEEQPELAAELAAQVTDLLSGRGAPGRFEPDRRIQLALLALGYMGKPVTEETVIEADRADPKDMVGIFHDVVAIQVLAQDSGDHEGARQLARSLRKEHPELIDIHRVLGSIALDQEAWQEALGHFQLYLTLKESAEPDRHQERSDSFRLGDVYNSLGLAHGRLGNYSAAAEAFHKAVEFDPMAAPHHFNLGHTHVLQSRYEEAEASLREVLRLEPDHSGALQDLQRMGRGAPPPTGDSS